VVTSGQEPLGACSLSLPVHLVLGEIAVAPPATGAATGAATAAPAAAVAATAGDGAAGSACDGVAAGGAGGEVVAGGVVGASASHAQRLCCTHLPEPLDYPTDPAEVEGGVAFGPEDVHMDVMWRRPVPCRAIHSVRLLLTGVGGESASEAVSVTVPRRPRLTGQPRGALRDGLAPPPPPQMATWKKVALAVLGLLTFVITLSFMMPVKFEWCVTKLGAAETAESLGLLAPKEGASAGWGRTLLATTTQTVKRFLTGHR